MIVHAQRTGCRRRSTSGGCRRPTSSARSSPTCGAARRWPRRCERPPSPTPPATRWTCPSCSVTRAAEGAADDVRRCREVPARRGRPTATAGRRAEDAGADPAADRAGADPDRLSRALSDETLRANTRCVRGGQPARPRRVGIRTTRELTSRRQGEVSKRSPARVPRTAWSKRPCAGAPGRTSMSLSDSVSERLLRERIILLGSRSGHQRQRDHRAAAAAGRRGPREGHHAVHQLAGRQRHGRDGDLRHDDVDRARRGDHRDGPGRVDGPVPAHRRGPGQARRAAAHPDPDAPAAAPASAAPRRHRHPGGAC